MEPTGVSSRGSISAAIAVARDGIAVLRDASIFLLAVLLLVFPLKLNALLTDAGFEEGSIVGFKWKAKLVSSDEALKDANAQLTDMRTQHDQLLTLLNEVSAQVHDPKLEQRIAQTRQVSSAVLKTALAVQASTEATIGANASLVNKAIGATDPKGWGVVFGGDTSLQAADYEVRTRAKQAGLPNPTVYLRQGSYRSVAISPDRDGAEAALAKARIQRQDAYLVSLTSWCPNPVARESYVECR